MLQKIRLHCFSSSELHPTNFESRRHQYGIMCGIHVVISASEPNEIPGNLRRFLCNRGPDHIATYEARLGDGGGNAPTTHLAFTSTVLALRGDHIARQPFVDEESGSVFCWNGEAWKVRHHDVAGNDGKAIAGFLNEAVRAEPDREAAIMRILRSVDGPFAFVFFDQPSKKLYFGRDRLGRRSLLFRYDEDQLVLSSVADSVDSRWKEVEADGVYVLDLGSNASADNNDQSLGSAKRLEWLEGDDAVDFVSSDAARPSGSFPYTGSLSSSSV